MDSSIVKNINIMDAKIYRRMILLSAKVNADSATIAEIIEYFRLLKQWQLLS